MNFHGRRRPVHEERPSSLPSGHGAGPFPLNPKMKPKPKPKPLSRFWVAAAGFWIRDGKCEFFHGPAAHRLIYAPNPEVAAAVYQRTTERALLAEKMVAFNFRGIECIPDPA